MEQQHVRLSKALSLSSSASAATEHWLSCTMPQPKTADDERLLLEVKRGNLRGVEKLLSAGSVNPNTTNDRGRTPLILASALHEATLRFSMVKSLLKAGADATLPTEKRVLPLHLASAMGDTDVMGIILAAAPGTLNVGDAAGFRHVLCCVRGQRRRRVLPILCGSK